MLGPLFNFWQRRCYLIWTDACVILLECEFEPVFLSCVILSGHGCLTHSDGWMVVWMTSVFMSGLGGVSRIKVPQVYVELHFEKEMCKYLCTPTMLCGDSVANEMPARRFRTCHPPQLHEQFLKINLSYSLFSLSSHAHKHAHTHPAGFSMENPDWYRKAGCLGMSEYWPACSAVFCYITPWCILSRTPSYFTTRSVKICWVCRLPLCPRIISAQRGRPLW